MGLVLFGLTGPASAAVKKHKPLETYSSIEPDAPTPPQATTVTVKVDAPTATAAVAAAPKKSPNFDAVPESLKGPLKERLALVEMLITEHGRAYDYRAMTIAQLRGILAELDAKRGAKAEAPAESATPSADEGP